MSANVTALSANITALSVNYTALDMAGILLAVIVLACFTVAPGYVLGWLLNLFDLRSRSLPGQLAIAVCLSVAFVPISVYLCWRFVPGILWVVFALAVVAAPVLSIRSRRGHSKPPRLTREDSTILKILAAWVVLGAFLLSDLQLGHRLYFPLVSFDYALRTAFTSAIARTGVPPLNPYFYPGHPYLLRYHYFWYMICALAVRLTHGRLSPRIAMIGGTIWAGIALIAMLALYLRTSFHRTPSRTPRRLLIATGLLAITGLDLIPTAAILLLNHQLNASAEWWNEPILSWTNSVVWQPHSVASLVACMTGLLLLRWASGQSAKARFAASLLCGAAFASASGLSIYVTFVFAVFLAVWCVVLAVRRQGSDAAMAAGALACMAFIAAPYALELVRSPAASGGSPIAFTVRSFYFAEGLALAIAPTHRWLPPLLNFAFLPLNYFLELGVFFVAGVLYCKRLSRDPRLDEQDVFELTLLCVALAVSTFLRSGTIAYNDLGWRAIIAAQLVLLLWAAQLWDEGVLLPKRRWVSGVGLLVGLGLAATVYDLTMLRVYPVLLDELQMPRYTWLAPDHKLGERTPALRETYTVLDRLLPRDALVQQNPNLDPQDLFFGLYGNRATAVDMPTCGVSFGGSPALCAELHPQVENLFRPASPVTPATLDGLCRRLSIAAVVVKDTDPVWKDRASWVWQRTPQIENPYARVFLCGKASNPNTPSPAAIP